MLPNNVIWSKRKNGKHQRQCKKCDRATRKNSPARKDYERRKYLKRSAKKLKFLNATGIIQGIMQCVN